MPLDLTGASCDPPDMKLIPRLVAIGFVVSILVLGVASWDVARGRVPDTASPLIIALLTTPEARTCTRDASQGVAAFIKPGMARGDVLAVLQQAVVARPAPWFWTPRMEDSIREQPDSIEFVRVMRYTAFGNHKVSGKANLRDNVLVDVTARVACAFG